MRTSLQKILIPPSSTIPLSYNLYVSHIFPFLSLPELFKLRLVCKYYQRLAEQVLPRFSLFNH